VQDGSVEMRSSTGPAALKLRAGSYAVVSVVEGEQSTSKIEALPAGAFLVTCTEGSVGVIPLQGSNGLFIGAGESVNISGDGVLSAAKRAVPPAAPAPATAESVPAAASETPSANGSGPVPAGIATVDASNTSDAPDIGAKKSNRRWIILGLAGGGAAAAGAALGA